LRVSVYPPAVVYPFESVGVVGVVGVPPPVPRAFAAANAAALELTGVFAGVVGAFGRTATVPTFGI
jgi:hypothetical protein